MNENWVLVLVIIAAVVTAIIVLFLLRYFIKYLNYNVLNPSGKGEIRRTTKILKRYSLLRGFQVLSDLVFELDGKPVPVENILVGHFGLLFVKTCPKRGEYYGDVEKQQWVLVDNNKRTKIPNLLLELDDEVRALRETFIKNKIYKISFDSILVFSNLSPKTIIYISPKDRIQTKKTFPGFLQRTKFDKDTGLDVPTISKFITQYSDDCKKKFAQNTSK